MERTLHPRTRLPVHLQEHLKRDKHTGVALAAILTHGASVDEMETFLQTANTQSICKLIESITLSTHYITQLSRHPSFFIRGAIAGFQVLPLDVRHALSHDKSLHVRNAMVCREDVTIQEMRDATIETSLVMSKKLALHPDTPSDVLDRIATRWGNKLRETLLQHRHLSDKARITISIM